mmetsp:Transcript_150275/g.482931  ORF Transcript_150275/g.482931 Transcript_150275/m.482931 type:complete len:238 (-) Transcript_150275:458-1171(-)
MHGSLPLQGSAATGKRQPAGHGGAGYPSLLHPGKQAQCFAGGVAAAALRQHGIVRQRASTIPNLGLGQHSPGLLRAPAADASRHRGADHGLAQLDLPTSQGLEQRYGLGASGGSIHGAEHRLAHNGIGSNISILQILKEAHRFCPLAPLPACTNCRIHDTHVKLVLVTAHLHNQVQRCRPLLALLAGAAHQAVGAHIWLHLQRAHLLVQAQGLRPIPPSRARVQGGAEQDGVGRDGR